MSLFSFMICLIFGIALFSERINAQARGEKKQRHRSLEESALRKLRVGKRHSKKGGCSKGGCTEKPTGAPSNEPSSAPSKKPTAPPILLMPLRDASDQELENRWQPAPIDIDDW
eukprot:CAMPEP_0198286392 /NCGR_PEP_ID=MMETSP1449-20131203/5490_1 /TAXON_ID=420275 /ORGANISM="Attheya septentrionalis, Strain CCMP2084" /LENGTH=113 /DNA_ID=CAMNT_0043984117 /DNA_START=280 /DNA_END=618 /DNA_ORIENTATION=-